MSTAIAAPVGSTSTAKRPTPGMSVGGVTTFGVILDLADLKHINSSGLGVFITLLTKARKKDGEVLLVSPSEGIRKLLLMTKLNAIFQIFDTVEAAMETVA